jgi:hypothetical protein
MGLGKWAEWIARIAKVAGIEQQRQPKTFDRETTEGARKIGKVIE